MKACLTLILPDALEEPVIDHLLRHSEWLGPFTAHPADGHGAPGAIASAAEQVRGRTRRVRIDVLVDSDHAGEVIDRLREAFQGADVFWWLCPVIELGTLA